MNEICENCEKYGLPEQHYCDLLRTVALPYTSPSWDSRVARFNIILLLYLCFSHCLHRVVVLASTTTVTAGGVSVMSRAKRKNTARLQKNWFRFLRDFFGSESRL
ncbi:unnamed protein product [Ectocarpus sp. 4 AP-2014]